tara:strand:+ start:187 stop:402 length:216 start_codon:yes stop_codon:yes gene_type:complete
MIYVELSDKVGQKEIELYGIFTISEVLDLIAEEADYETDDESCSDEESDMDTDEEMEAAREEARMLHLDLD